MAQPTIMNPTTAGGGGGGFGAGFMDLMKNPLVQQMMLQLGGELNPDIKGVNSVAAEAGAAKQQSSLMQRFLGQMTNGEMPAGGKLSMDDKGVKFNLPNTEFANILGGESVGEAGAATDTSSIGGAKPGTLAAPVKKGMFEGLSNFSPSQQGNALDVSSFAGLSPTDVNNAMTQSMALYEMLNPPGAEMAPVPIPGVGSVSLKAWDSMPENDKNFALQTHLDKLEGNDPMTRREFELSGKTAVVSEVRNIMEANPDWGFMKAYEYYRKHAGGSGGGEPYGTWEKKRIFEMQSQGYEYLQSDKYLEGVAKVVDSSAAIVARATSKDKEGDAQKLGIDTILNDIRSRGGIFKAKPKLVDGMLIIKVQMPAPDNRVMNLSYDTALFKRGM